MSHTAHPTPLSYIQLTNKLASSILYSRSPANVSPKKIKILQNIVWEELLKPSLAHLEERNKLLLSGLPIPPHNTSEIIFTATPPTDNSLLIDNYSTFIKIQGSKESQILFEILLLFFHTAHIISIDSSNISSHSRHHTTIKRKSYNTLLTLSENERILHLLLLISHHLDSICLENESFQERFQISNVGIETLRNAGIEIPGVTTHFLSSHFFLPSTNHNSFTSLNTSIGTNGPDHLASRNKAFIPKFSQNEQQKLKSIKKILDSKNSTQFSEIALLNKNAKNPPIGPLPNIFINENSQPVPSKWDNKEGGLISLVNYSSAELQHLTNNDPYPIPWFSHLTCNTLSQSNASSIAQFDSNTLPLSSWFPKPSKEDISFQNLNYQLFSSPFSFQKTESSKKFDISLPSITSISPNPIHLPTEPNNPSVTLSMAPQVSQNDKKLNSRNELKENIRLTTWEDRYAGHPFSLRKLLEKQYPRLSEGQESTPSIFPSLYINNSHPQSPNEQIASEASQYNYFSSEMTFESISKRKMFHIEKILDPNNSRNMSGNALNSLTTQLNMSLDDQVPLYISRMQSLKSLVSSPPRFDWLDCSLLALQGLESQFFLSYLNFRLENRTIDSDFLKQFLKDNIGLPVDNLIPKVLDFVYSSFKTLQKHNTHKRSFYSENYLAIRSDLCFFYPPLCNWIDFKFTISKKNANKFLIPNELLTPMSYKIFQQFARIGSLVRRLYAFIYEASLQHLDSDNNKKDNQPPLHQGQVIQAFVSQVSELLKNFSKEVISISSHYRLQFETKSPLELWTHLQAWFRQIEYLSWLCQVDMKTFKSPILDGYSYSYWLFPKGVNLLEYIFEKSCSLQYQIVLSHPASKLLFDMSSAIFISCIQPLNSFLDSYVFKGKFYDPFYEFSQYKDTNRDYTNHSYLKTHHNLILPNFLKNLLGHIYLCHYLSKTLRNCSEILYYSTLLSFSSHSIDLLKSSSFASDLPSLALTIHSNQFLQFDSTTSFQLEKLKKIQIQRDCPNNYEPKLSNFNYNNLPDKPTPNFPSFTLFGKDLDDSEIKSIDLHTSQISNITSPFLVPYVIKHSSAEQNATKHSPRNFQNMILDSGTTFFPCISDSLFSRDKQNMSSKSHSKQSIPNENSPILRFGINKKKLEEIGKGYTSIYDTAANRLLYLFRDKSTLLPKIWLIDLLKIDKFNSSQRIYSQYLEFLESNEFTKEVTLDENCDSTDIQFNKNTSLIEAVTKCLIQPIKIQYNLINAALIAYCREQFLFSNFFNEIKKYLLFGHADLMNNSIVILFEERWENFINSTNSIINIPLDTFFPGNKLKNPSNKFHLFLIKDPSNKSINPAEKASQIKIFFSTSSPLDLFFDPDTSLAYESIFQLITTFKYSEHCLNKIWTILFQHLKILYKLGATQTSNSKITPGWKKKHKDNLDESQKEILKQLQAFLNGIGQLRKEIQFVFTALHEYVMCESIEVTWERLMQDFANLENFTSLIHSHSKWIKKIQQKCFLDHKTNQFKTIIFKLLEQIYDLKELVVLLPWLPEFPSKNLGYLKHLSSYLEDYQLSERMITLCKIKTEFHKNRKLISSIMRKLYHLELFRTLSIRLDFNSFYINND